MKFKLHLFVQKHHNGMYTVRVLPFNDVTGYGPNLEEIKADLRESVAELIRDAPQDRLHILEFDPNVRLEKVEVELRPMDARRKKRARDKVKVTFSLLIKPEGDQLLVSVPKLGPSTPTFYVYNRDELQEVAAAEIASWFSDATLEEILRFRYARSETLDVLEVETELRKSGEGITFGPSESSFWALKEVGINLSAQAAEGRFHRLYRRDEEVETILRSLAGTRRRSILLTGESEVGKTAIIYEVVRRIWRKECDERLHDRQVWMITPDRLIAGAGLIGTWEERLADIVNECRREGHILYVDDLTGLLEIGRWSKSDENVAQALKPYIENNEVVLIGECSPARLRTAEALGPGFLALFRTLTVQPMPEEETLSVLGSVSRDLEREMDVRIEPGAVDAALEITKRFLPYRAFPGKAIRLLEETTADAAKTGEDGDERPRTVITRQHVIDTFARQSGMPAFMLSDQASLSAEEVESYLSERILGQPEAVRAVTDLILTIKAGLNDPEKPLGCFLFIGPTGVGKTQMAKTLAEYLFGDEDRLIRFDMSEYTDLDGLSRLIGGFGHEGELTRRVREQPFCVLLLDEFEKAAPPIYDIFLQVLGEGRLTDASGRTTFFHNAIIIMTSNLGSSPRSTRSLSILPDEEKSQAERFREKVEEYFRPEFVNRLDQIVVFRPLDHEALRKIAIRELKEILARDGITRRNVLVEIDEDVIDLVLEEGYTPAFGARPLKRAIERLIVSPLARALAQLKPGTQQLMRLNLKNGEVSLKIIPISQAERTAKVRLIGSAAANKGRQVRMGLPELIEGFAAIRRKLADWRESALVADMRNERDRLLAETHQADFWDDEDYAGDAVNRFHFLDRLLRRLDQLLERAEYLEDFAILVNRQRDLSYRGDLARDYEKLHRDASYLEIELLTAHIPYRNQAVMVISRVGMSYGPAGSKPNWPHQLAEMYMKWATHKGYDLDLYVLSPPEPPDHPAPYFTRLSAGSFRDLLKRFAAYPNPDRVAIFLRGANVFGFLKGERGLHKLIGREGSGEEIAVAEVFALVDGVDVDAWLEEYLSTQRRLARNRSMPHQQQFYSVIRTYALGKTDKYIRDLRTGVRLTNVKEVMGKGMLDDFILAYLHQEEPASGLQDDIALPPMMF